MRAVLSRRQLDLHAVLDNVHDPHNAAAVFRSADAFALGTVHLLYTDEVFPRISRAVAGHAQKWLQVRRHRDAAELAAWAAGAGVQLVATHLDAGTRDYREVDWTRPTAIALGNEQRGCSPELLAVADLCVAIPMRGMAQSLNVSVAGAVLFAEAARQRDRAALTGPRWDAEREAILARWIAREDPTRHRG